MIYDLNNHSFLRFFTEKKSYTGGQSNREEWPLTAETVNQSRPLGRENCVREICVICKSDEEHKPKCRTSSCTYRTLCKLCTKVGARSTYIGETSRSIIERMGEHANDAVKQDKGSHIMNHQKHAHFREWEELGG